MNTPIRVIGILLLSALAGAGAWMWWSQSQPPRGEPLPELVMTPLDGRAGFDTAELEGPYLINIWGSWCGPCRIEHPVLMALQSEGIAIYGINWRDNAADANDFLSELGDPFAGVMQDLDESAVRALGIQGAPETLVISSRGEILTRWPGPITADVLHNYIYPAIEQDLRHARQ